MPTKSPTATGKCSQNAHAVKQAKLGNLFKKTTQHSKWLFIYLRIKFSGITHYTIKWKSFDNHYTIKVKKFC